MPMDKLPALVPPSNASADATKEARVPAFLRVKSGQVIGIEDHLGNVLGLPVTAKVLDGGIVKGIAPSGTVAADGTITLGTALPAVFSAGLWLYLPAGAVTGGSAGFYWCDMSSTTVGVVRAAQGGPALTGSGSAYTGVTSEITLASYTILGGSLKKLRIEALIAQTNSAGTKTVKGKYGSGQFLNAPATTTPQQNFALHVMKVAPGVQHASNAAAAGGTSLAAWMTTDDSVDQPLYITGQLAVATDYLLCVATNLILLG